MFHNSQLGTAAKQKRWMNATIPDVENAPNNARWSSAEAVCPKPLDPGGGDEDNRPRSCLGVCRMCETIGSYRVIEPLGRGGMGIVYRARHIGSERAIALKTVSVPAPRWLDNIRREVQALTRIRHPGVVRIVDHGVHQGRPWYAMDLIEGESLRRFGQRIWSPWRPMAPPVSSTEGVSATEDLHGRWRDTPEDSNGSSLPGSIGTDGIVPPAGGELSQLLAIMRRLCATLAYLHGEGFVNGDLKPENVLLVGDQPVIIDFGLTAHHPGGCGREALEAQSGMSGTLPYMSPEQIRGEFLDARSDLYSVGCILYELVTGVQPFTGSPRGIIQQHLTATPVPPSQLVAGLPKELELLMLKLLEKDLTLRYGYADEVAAQLAEVGHDARRLSYLPPARSYIYRPRLVGREVLLSVFTELRERAIAGSGSLVLLGGESGVGKTRLAMELTRLVPNNRMRVVTSETSVLSTDGAPAVAPAPLHVLRPLLQAVADRCQEGGSEVAQRLVGDRSSVLAMYEPVLAQIPGLATSAPAISLGAEASRQRLFKYLSETLGCFSEDQPLLWVIDDLGWADELSLAFLRSLTAQFFESHAVLIVCTYRTEEPSEGVAAIAELPYVPRLTLPRLGKDAVRTMIGDMLALRGSLGGFTDFVAGQAEGNPFFVAEYLRAAVDERILYRDRLHSWQLVNPTQDDGHDPETNRDYEAISLPRSLRALLEHRLRQLSPAARQTGLAAAVLGRETDLATLLEVASLSDEASVGAVDELMRRQILEQPEPEKVRFAHDKLREVTCSQAPPEQLRDLHGRAATVLERRWRDRPDASRQWATLGHHFAAAQVSERAVHYLQLAADYARHTYANGDAIRLYREAIAHVNDILLRLESDPAPWHEALVELYEALGDVLALTAQRDQARAAYDQALGQVPGHNVVARARLHRKSGKTWETQHDHEQALRCYALAMEKLGTNCLDVGSEPRDEWIQTNIDQAWVYYWLGRVKEMDAIVAKLSPVIERHGTRSQRVRFFENQTMVSMRRDRYVVTEATLGFARLALDACRGSEQPEELPSVQLGYGFALLFHNSLPAAVRELEAAEELARRAGDSAQQARALAYLALATRMRRQLQETQVATNRLLEVATAAGTRDYFGAARAHQSWLSLQAGDLAAVPAQAEEALQIWRSLTTYVYPFQWIALLPLMEVALRCDDMERAISCIDPLLAPSQHYLAGTATDALVRARKCWRDGDRGGTRSSFDMAMKHLGETNYR
jgi:eukaryotic-like serine/threonine-protein kinase